MSDTQLASMRLGAIETDAERIQRQKSGNIIFILDGQTDQVLDFIHRENVIENVHRKSLKDTFETFEMTVIGDKPYAEHLGKRNGLIVPGEDGELLEFRIFETVKYRQGSEILIDVYAVATYLDLKKAKVYDEQQTDPMTAIQHATEALSGTEWQVGKVDFSGIRTLTFDSPFNPYTYLKRIASEFELELMFYITSDGTKVTGRYVDIVEQVGEWRGRTIEFGQDLQGIERKERQDIVTALYGYGPEREDGTRLKVFVEDEEARRRWGRHGRHLVDAYEPDSSDQSMTEARLRQLTRAELDKRINTAVEYRADINDLEYVPGMENKKIRFGDTIRIKDTKFNPALYLEARVHTQERDVFNKNRKRIELGDFEEFTEEEVRAIWRQLQEQIRQKISQAELVEYAERKVQRDTIPPENTEHLWLDTSTEPNVLKRYDEVKADWVKATPTEADEVGAETPEGAQQKADEAKQEAISYSENFTISYAQKQISSSTTPPANPEIGDLWFDSSTQPPTFRRWNGSEWEKLSASSFEELEGMIDKSQLPDRVIDSMKLAIDAVQSENIAPSSVDFENLMDDAVRGAKIAAEAVASIHIQNGAVNNDKLDNLAVTAEKLASGSVVEDKIFDGAVGTAKLADAAITSAKISEAAINEAHIAEAAVGTAAIQDLAVTNAKIANIHADKITAGVLAAERVAIGPLTQFADGYDPTKIEVGGRNLLQNSTFNNGLSGWDISSSRGMVLNPESDKPNSNILQLSHINDTGNTNVNSPQYSTNRIYLEPKAGDKITFSFDFYCENESLKPTGTIMTFRRFENPTGGSYVEAVTSLRYEDSNANGIFGKWVRVKHTSTFTSSNAVSGWYAFAVYLSNSSSTFKEARYKYREIKVELGDKATDWTPAPVDNPALLWQYEDTVYIDGGNIYANTITSNQIAAGAITTNELATNAVTANKIAANAVTANKIQAEAVGAQAIAANAILAKHIAAGEVTANHLAADAVTADAIAAGAILAEHISANSINSSKIATEGLDANVIKTGVLDADLVAVRSSNSGTYIDSDGILVDSGSFRLRDEITQVESEVRENANMVNDHSFEAIMHTGTEVARGVYTIDRSNMGNNFWWNVHTDTPAYAQILTTYDTDDYKLAKFGLQAAVLRNVTQAYWYQYVELNAERGTAGPYTISCYFSAFELTNTNTECEIVLQAYDDEYNWLDDVARASTTVLPSEPFSWKRVSATVRNLPQDTLYLRIRINTRGGFALADGVQLVPFEHPVVYEAEEGLWKAINNAPGYGFKTVETNIVNAWDSVYVGGGSGGRIWHENDTYFRIRSVANTHNGSIVFNRNSQSISIYQNGAFRHTFYADGSKSGGSIEHGGTVYGMSPVDSPRVVLHDYLFNREIEGEKVFELDRTFADSMAHYDVLSFNPDIRVEVIDRYRFKAIGNGKTTFLIAGPRRSYEDIYWTSINPIDVEDEEEEGGNQIEH